MMKKLVILLGSILLLLALSCSSNPIEEGDALFKEGQYSSAIKQYSEALKNDPSNASIKEKIALSFMKLGERNYKRRGVISSFEAYKEKALPYVSENSSIEFKRQWSDLLTELGEAHIKQSPQNIKQRRERFDAVLTNLEDAVYYNPENSKAKELLQTFKTDNFMEMLTSGKKYFERARKEKNDLYYLNAEYYLKKAVEFDSGNREATKLLQKVRKINLNKYDPDLDFPLAVTQTVTHEKATGISIYLKNNSGTGEKISASDFTLYDKEGQSYTGEESDIFSNGLEEITLESGKDLEGVITFMTEGKKSKQFDVLVFTSKSGKETRKYFP